MPRVNGSVTFANLPDHEQFSIRIIPFVESRAQALLSAQNKNSMPEKELPMMYELNSHTACATIVQK